MPTVYQPLPMHTKITMRLLPALMGGAALLLGLSAQAQEAAIRKALSERIPQLQKIDEISATPMAGLYEVRVGTDVFYSDAKGNYLIQGELIDTQAHRNLTEDRLNKLTAVDFNSLPFKDAIKVVRGDGSRKIAVFEDPNCGYCKRFEKDLQGVNNITVYTFLYPILSPDSVEKSRNIWCAKDPGKEWADHMTKGKDAPAASASCDVAAVQRNMEFGRRYKITGTPTIFFADGTRVPGAITGAELEKRIKAAGS